LKLLRKTFERLLFERKYVDFRNFFGKCLRKNLKDLPKKILRKGAQFRNLFGNFLERIKANMYKSTNLVLHGESCVIKRN